MGEKYVYWIWYILHGCLGHSLIKALEPLQINIIMCLFGFFLVEIFQFLEGGGLSSNWGVGGGGWSSNWGGGDMLCASHRLYAAVI